MYEELTRILTELGEPSLAVRSAVAVQFGCIARQTFGDPMFSPDMHVLDADEAESLATEEPPVEAFEFAEAVINILEKHPYMSATRQLGDTLMAAYKFAGPLTLEVGSRVFALHVNLPESQQKARHLYFGEKPVEEFDVITVGSLFATLVPCADYPTWTHAGIQFAEFLKRQLTAGTVFEPRIPIARTMVPVFYFVQCQKRDNGNRIGRRVYADKDPYSLFVVFDYDAGSHIEMVAHFLVRYQHILASFYSVELIRMILGQQLEAVLSDFSGLSSSVGLLLSMPWWRIRKSSGLLSTSEAALSKLHSKRVESEISLLHFLEERRQLVELIELDQTFSLLMEYFQRETKEYSEIPEALPSALAHFDGMLQSYKNPRLAVIAGLVTTIVGAVLGALLAWLLSM